ncbi:MAG TPA: GDSL-type esterase/lipase family protein [Povalibacter sp.]
MFSRFSFTPLLLALIACGTTSHAVAQAPVRIMPLGDSITAGPGCWRAYLWNQLQTAGYSNIDFVGGVSDGGGCNPGFSYDFDHEGHSGFSITGIADANQLPPWLTAARPDIIVMHLGTNDMWGGWIPLETKITALTKLIGQMRAYNAGIKIVAAQIIPMNPSGCTTCMGDVVAFNSALGTLATSLTTAQSPIYVVDQWTGFDVVADTYDAVHPVTSGFIKMANRFSPAVQQAINATSSQLHLTVTKSGTGSGTVTSSTGGINCGSTCGANYANGTPVTLTATAASGSTFVGWGGACSGTGTCTVSMTQARTVFATFDLSGTTTYYMTVTKSGTGGGTVTTSPAGINCGSTCSAGFVAGTPVTITATPAANSTFAGFGSCGNPCTVVMDQPRAFVATFNAAQTYALSVSKSGSGTGVVTSSPSGINCGSTCTANYTSGTSVTLAAAAASNSTFAGWSGACSGTSTCAVSLTQARSVTATFNTQATYALTVTKTGTGAGTVTSSPSGINCGTTCSASFGGNAAVTLTATPASGSTFAGWSGACSGTSSCTLSMSQARSVTATFNTSGGTGGTCANPVTFSGNSGNFNTAGAVCYRTSANVSGWGCYNFDGRTLTVGGVARTCGQMPLTRAADGYYYFAVTAGQYPWAGLYIW